MIASYLLSSSLVPVFSTWLMREAHRGEEHEGIFGRLRSFYERYLRVRPALPLAAGAGLSGRGVRTAVRAAAAHGNRIVSRMPTLRSCASVCARRPARASRRPSASSCAPST